MSTTRLKQIFRTEGNDSVTYTDPQSQIRISTLIGSPAEGSQISYGYQRTVAVETPEMQIYKSQIDNDEPVVGVTKFLNKTDMSPLIEDVIASNNNNELEEALETNGYSIYRK